MSPRDFAARTVSAALVAVALHACGASEATPPAGDGAADAGDTPPGPRERRLVLGTGEAEFEPMQGEPRLRLVAGAQGGFHVWASFLAYGFPSEEADLVLETRVEDDPAQRLEMRAHLRLRDVIDANGEPARSFAGFPAQIDDAPCAHDKRITVRAALSYFGAGIAEDTRYCIAEVDPAQRRDDCGP